MNGLESNLLREAFRCGRQKRITFAPQVTVGACPSFPGFIPITWNTTQTHLTLSHSLHTEERKIKKKSATWHEILKATINVKSSETFFSFTLTGIIFFLFPNQSHYLNHPRSPSNTIHFPRLSLSFIPDSAWWWCMACPSRIHRNGHEFQSSPPG